PGYFSRISVTVKCRIVNRILVRDSGIDRRDTTYKIGTRDGGGDFKLLAAFFSTDARLRVRFPYFNKHGGLAFHGKVGEVGDKRYILRLNLPAPENQGCCNRYSC